MPTEVQALPFCIFALSDVLPKQLRRLSEYQRGVPASVVGAVLACNVECKIELLRDPAQEQWGRALFARLVGGFPLPK